MLKTSIAIVFVLAIAGCASTAGDFCLVSSPIRPSASDSLTEGTARQVLAHNEYGMAACNWRP